MWKNYLKIAWRNLWRSKTFSAVNLFGLTVGTACCLYILLYVQDHRSYDTHHREAENLYRVISDLQLPNEQDDLHMATCSPPIPMGIKADFPEVEAAARACRPIGVEMQILKAGDQVHYEKSGYYVDSNFFQILDYHFLEGNPATALNEPYSVVISEKLAKKMFNTHDALDQVIGITTGNTEEKFKVTGVFSGALGKSHLLPEFFMTMNSGGLGEYIRNSDSWAGNNFVYGYLRLKSGADPHLLEAKLPAFLERRGAEQFEQMGLKKTLHLQPVSSIHTTSGLTADLPGNTGARFLQILILIAGFIQLVACINFMNLTTARSTKRAQEVGIRKATGASRTALVGQFLGESMLLTVLAMAMAVPLVKAALPFLNHLTGAEVALRFGQNWSAAGVVAALTLLTGLAAGSYPAFYLSSFRPLTVLRGITALPGKTSASWLRKGMVVSQFAISAALVIGALIVRTQLNYMLEKDLGFEKEQKVVFPFRSEESRAGLETFSRELMRLSEVGSASAMAVVPGQMVYNDVTLFEKGKSVASGQIVRFTYCDEHYLNTLKIKLIAGRQFTPADTFRQERTGQVIINEKALKQLGIAVQDAPGRILSSNIEDETIEFAIIGVMQDFLYENLGSSMDPFMVVYEQPGRLNYMVADINSSDYAGFFKKAAALWGSAIPNQPFEYSFLDEDLARLYLAEKNLANIVSAFTLIAIFISCLGLFGLSVFTAEQRTKEIGIRKVLGASAAGIVALLSKDFLKLVGIALIVASPPAWYFMNKWLENFAYRIDIPWWVFALAGVLAVSVAFLTVSFQSMRAALANPVDSLRSE